MNYTPFFQYLATFIYKRTNIKQQKFAHSDKWTAYRVKTNKGIVNRKVKKIGVTLVRLPGYCMNVSYMIHLSFMPRCEIKINNPLYWALSPESKTSHLVLCSVKNKMHNNQLDPLDALKSWLKGFPDFVRSFSVFVSIVHVVQIA